MNLTERLVALERHWRSTELETPTGLVPAGAAELDRLISWLSPPGLPAELLELYRWFGGAGDVLLPAVGPTGALLAPGSAVEQFLEFYRSSIGAPWPRCLVPVLVSHSTVGTAEIVPGGDTCPVWGFQIEDGIFGQLYPSLADLVVAIHGLTPYTESMAERGDDALAEHVAAVSHPDLFDLGASSSADPSTIPGLVRARTSRALFTRQPDGPEAELLGAWPEHWLAGRQP